MSVAAKNLRYTHYKSERDRLRDTAWKLTKREIREGRMPPPTACKCADCGEPAYCYDHRDYRKPIDVEPVCRACNVRRGPALPAPQKHDNADTKKGADFNAGKGWSYLDGEGDGFEPLTAHLNGIAASDLDQLAAPMDLFQTLEQMAECDARRALRGGPAGTARAEWFKKKDPWYA